MEPLGRSVLTPQRTYGTRWLAHLLLLLTVAVLPRFLVVAKTVAPARDALRFWAAAYHLEHDPFPQSVRDIDVQPVYPASLVVLRWLGAPENPQEWLLLNQWWSIVSYLIFLVLAFAVGTTLWGTRVAFWGCLAVATLPRQITYSCDVLSDSLFAALWMASLALLVWNVTVWPEGSNLGRAATCRWMACGLLAACAYLTRTEGLLLPCVVIATLGTLQMLPQTRVDWRGRALAAIAFALPFAILSGTYVGSTGRVSPRNSAQALLGGSTIPENRQPMGSAPLAFGGEQLEMDRAEPMTQLPGLFSSLVVLGREIGQETRGWIAALALYAIVVVGASWRPKPAAIPIALAMLGCGAMLTLLHNKAGFLAGRYLTPILPFVGMIAILGVEDLRRKVVTIRRFPWENTWGMDAYASRRRWALTIALMAVAIGLSLPRWLRPLHPYRHGHMQAAQWLAQHSRPTDLVFDPMLFTAYFAVRSSWWPRLPLPETLPCRFAVIDPSALLRCDDQTRQAIDRVGREGTLVAKFAKTPDSHQTGVYVFEMPRLVAQQAMRGTW